MIRFADGSKLLRIGRWEPTVKCCRRTDKTDWAIKCQVKFSVDKCKVMNLWEANCTFRQSGLSWPGFYCLGARTWGMMVGSKKIPALD